MRQAYVLIHRWLGLTVALFLIVSGLTGAVISWEHELDEWLNDHLYDQKSQGKPLPPLALVDIVEKADPRVRVSMFPLEYEEGHTAKIWVDARRDPATAKRFEPGYDHVFVDTVTGQIVGKRLWGKVAVDKENIMAFLYKLHYTLHFPEVGGTDRWGVWLMGVVALIWLIDSFVAFLLTLPRRARTQAAKAPGRLALWWQRWKPAWLIRFNAGGYKLNFDLHRAGGLWVWGIILVIAFTSFSLNLYREVFYPLMSLVSKTTPGPFESRKPTPLHEPVEPKVSWTQLIETGRIEAARRGWTDPMAEVFYSDNFAIMGIRFFQPHMDHESGGMMVRNLYYDGVDGRLIGDRIPWAGSAADVFAQLQFPLHSGRILGLTGRILMSIMGLTVAMLSITGIIIWLRKRRAQARVAQAKPVAGDALPAAARASS